MADDTIEVIVPFQNRSSNPPTSSTGYDYKVLSQDQQKRLNDLKIHTIRENYLYLKEHPEISALVTVMLRAVFMWKPRNAQEFLASYMKCPKTRCTIKTMVEKEQRRCEEKSSRVESIASSSGDERPPFSLANIVFPSSLKVEDYQLEPEPADKDVAIIDKDIMNDILNLVEEKIIQKEDIQYISKFLDSEVKNIKSTVYPPCEPHLYRHTTSENERKAKERLHVGADIADDILIQVEEKFEKENTQYITNVMDSRLQHVTAENEEHN